MTTATNLSKFLKITALFFMLATNAISANDTLYDGPTSKDTGLVVTEFGNGLIVYDQAHNQVGVGRKSFSGWDVYDLTGKKVGYVITGLHRYFIYTDIYSN
jgi:hypothetical protein